MNSDINKAAASNCYGLYDGENIIGFCAVLHFPHPHNPRIKRISRLVILPDYQGIGLGRKFLNFVSDLYVKQGFDVSITSSAKNLIQALVKDEKWSLSRYDHVASISASGIQLLNKTVSKKRVTATFFRKKMIDIPTYS